MGYWIKYYTEILDDPKMALQDDHTWRRISELFLLAGKLDRGGQLPGTAEIAWLLREADGQRMQADLEHIAQIGIIRETEGGWLVVRFEERQDAASDAERKKAQRERDQRKEYTRHNAVTKRDVDTESESETEEKRGEREGERAPAPALPAAGRGDVDLEDLTPMQAEQIPEIQVFVGATGRMPGRPTYRTVVDLIRLHRWDAKHLKPFWTAWNLRGYRPENLGWLTDWAVQGSIPAPPGQARQAGSGKNGRSASDELSKLLEAEHGN